MYNVSNNGSSSKFQDYISEAAIICHSQAATAQEIICELIAKAVERTPALDVEEVKKEVFAREAMFPTVIAPGLAMPHARIDNLDKLVVALATSENGVDFGGSDAGYDNVKVVVLVLSPSDNPGLHLHVVSALAREFNDLEKIGQLAGLTSADKVVEFFGVVPVRLPEFLLTGDLATPVSAVVQEDDSLEFAFRKFAETRATQIAVLDDEGNLCGVITPGDILKYSTPAGYPDSDDKDFRVFANVIARAENIKVGEVMSKDFAKINADVRAVELVTLFLQSPEAELLVVDENNHLSGSIKLRDFAAKLFWE